MKQDYRFEYSGKVSPGANPISVKLGLSKLFSVEPTQLDAVFTGDAIFVRDPIAEITARKYQEKFRRVGALGTIGASTRDAPKAFGEEQYDDPRRSSSPTDNTPEPATPCCPKCQSANINDEQCFDCGIYIQKYKAKFLQQEQAEVEESPFDHELEDQSAERRSGVKWIAFSVTAIYALLLIDGQLSQLLMAFSPSMNIGVFPFMLVHLGLVYGCVQYASAKGYNPLLGFLGVFSLAGLSVLLVLKDRDTRYNATSFKQILFALFCIGYSGYWSLNKVVEHRHAGAVLAVSETLAEGRSQFPSQQLDQDERIIEREKQELHEHIAAVVTLLKERNFSNIKQVMIVNALMQSVVDYQQWQNYQTYLFHRQEGGVPDYLKRKDRYAQAADIMDLLEDGLNLNGQPTPASITAKSWFFGDFSPLQQDVDPWPNLNSYLAHLGRDINIFIAEYVHENLEPGQKPKIDLTLMERYTTKSEYALTIDSNTIRIDLKYGKLGRRYITLAYYVIMEKRFGKTRFGGVDSVLVDTNIPIKKIGVRYNGLDHFPRPGERD